MGLFQPQGRKAKTLLLAWLFASLKAYWERDPWHLSAGGTKRTNTIIVAMAAHVRLHLQSGPTRPRSGSGLSQRADDRPVGFLGKSLKRDGAQIAL